MCGENSDFFFASSSINDAAFSPRTKSKDRDRQVIEVVRHAFGSYPVNKALTSSWTRPPEMAASVQSSPCAAPCLSRVCSQVPLVN